MSQPPNGTHEAATQVMSRQPSLLRCSFAFGGVGEGGSQAKAKHLESKLPPYQPSAQEPVALVGKRGHDVLSDPWYNKGTGFPLAERERLGLRGLLPPQVSSMEAQLARFMAGYQCGVELIPPEEVLIGGVTSEMARRWTQLQQLQDRNETLFYKVLIQHFTEMSSIIYTPTVGWVCSNYHRLYRKPRGMFFSAQDKGQMAAIAWNWPADDVHAIVVTDGSRILGLGDLGLNGLGIPIGKLDLYCAAAGFHPRNVLPVVLDVGTNNEALRADPLYVGLRQPRVDGPEYYELLDEFVKAVMSRWPSAVLQFEDFQMKHALTLLRRYRDSHLVFNDDIQGTAATALAGVYGALRVLQRPARDIAQLRVVCAGAGSAGMGVVGQIAAGMEKQGGLSPAEAAANFWVLDVDGLITRHRKELPDYVARFARATNSSQGREGDRLLEVVRQVKPHVLLGLAGAGKLFTADVLAAMAEGCERPVIFPMSNPTIKMECTAEEAITATNGRCIFASGSPQQCSGDHAVSQANNMYIFPGLALGAHLGQTRHVSDGMLMTAAETLPRLISDAAIAKGFIYPDLQDIRAVSTEIAAEVILMAAAEGHLGSDEAAAKASASREQLLAWIRAKQFQPSYASLTYVQH